MNKKWVTEVSDFGDGVWFSQVLAVRVHTRVAHTLRVVVCGFYEALEPFLQVQPRFVEVGRSTRNSLTDDFQQFVTNQDRKGPT
jgi:hypothetical protein